MTRYTLAITVLGIALLSVGVASFTSIRAASDDAMDLARSAPLGPGLERYIDPERGFFFDYPAGLSITETDNLEDRLIFGDTADGEARLLITAYPYVYDEPLTEDILQAEPFAIDITSSIDRMTLPSGTTVFLFQKADSTFGATRDALFVHYGTVYNVNVAADFEELFNQILESWRFTSSTTP